METRTKKIAKIKAGYGEDCLIVRHKNIYMKRLELKYFKKGKEKSFKEQFENGDGNELKKHFWSVNSSSRLCFEMYSWLTDEPEITDIEFEKQLTNIKFAPKVPNMDTYIEYNDNIVFIENKFTEKSKLCLSKLPDAYYKELGEAKNSTKTKLLHSSLNERYRNTGIEKFIISFIDKINTKIESSGIKGNSWLDMPQEIKHLIGIVFEVLNNRYIYENKHIKFYNIYYDFGDRNEEFVDWFFEEAQKMVCAIFEKFDCKVTFEYKHKTVQEVVEMMPERLAYGSSVLGRMHGSTNKGILNTFLNNEPIIW